MTEPSAFSTVTLAISTLDMQVLVTLEWQYIEFSI